MHVIDYPQLSSTEQEAYDELRKRIGNVLDESLHDGNFCYYRFLKARNFNVDRAEEMLKKTLQWRKDFKVASIFEVYEPAECLKIAFDHNLIGFDKEGCPVFFITIGRLDIRGVLLSIRDVDVEKMFIRFMENAEKALRDQSKKLNKPITKMSVIGDVGGLSFASATNKRAIEAVIRLAQLQQDNYPERLKSLFFINASGFVTLPFSIIKHFLAAEILNKLQFIASSDDWEKALLEEIDEKELPVFLGGKRTGQNGDQTGKSLVYQGGKVDESNYLRKSKKCLSSSSDVKKLVLSRASFSEIVLEILEKDSLVEWEFETKTRDIGFGLFFKEIVDGEEVITELVSLQRLDTEEFSEIGMYCCQKPGTYVMLFDNSYSWIRSKEVYYRVKVVSPKVHNEKIQDKNMKTTSD